MTSEEARVEDAKKWRVYDGKIGTLTAINDALRRENEQIRLEFHKGSPTAPQAAHTDVEELTEEFSRRLGAADRTIAQLQNERGLLQEKLKHHLEGGSVTEARLQEKEQYIIEVLAEGEKLSKKVASLEALSSQLDGKLKASEQENEKLSFQNRAAEERIISLQSELANEESTAKAAACDREEALTQTVEELRLDIFAAADREATLRSENTFLEARIRQLECATQNLNSGATEATRPLLRQIEAMTAAAREHQTAARLSEGNFKRLIRGHQLAAQEAEKKQLEAFDRIENLVNEVRTARGEHNEVLANHATMESQLQKAREEGDVLRERTELIGTELAAARQTIAELLKEKRVYLGKQDDAVEFPELVKECPSGGFAEGEFRMLQQQLRLAEQAREVALLESNHKLNLALELLGDRNERIEILEEDIREMKRIFHEQLNEAMLLVEKTKLN